MNLIFKESFLFGKSTRFFITHITQEYKLTNWSKFFGENCHRIYFLILKFSYRTHSTLATQIIVVYKFSYYYIQNCVLEQLNKRIYIDATLKRNWGSKSFLVQKSTGK